ncbi:MAG: hypothetical protein V7K50_24010 [Nostoc sp.]
MNLKFGVWNLKWVSDVYNGLRLRSIFHCTLDIRERSPFQVTIDGDRC